MKGFPPGNIEDGWEGGKLGSKEASREAIEEKSDKDLNGGGGNSQVTNNYSHTTEWSSSSNE